MPGKKVKQPLSVTHPELAKEAVGWDPIEISAGSNKKLEWVCKLGRITNLHNPLANIFI
jgi:hypothetical protein